MITKSKAIRFNIAVVFDCDFPLVLWDFVDLSEGNVLHVVFDSGVR